jgi:hypothetical protein
VSIGEATSRDGITFQRVDADPSTPELDPVLDPRPSPGPVPDGAVGPFDTGQVSDPCVLPEVSPAGRLVVRVLYTGYDGPPSDTARSSAIGFAARFGTTGRLSRHDTPVFSIMMHEAAPTYLAWDGGEMLYVQASPYASLLMTYGPPEIAAGLAPPTRTLPPTRRYPSSP